MSQQININDSVILIPNGYNSSHSSYSSVNSSYPISNGYTDTSSSTYAYITCNTGSSASSYISYTFPSPDIPSGATITSVSASARVRVSSTSYISTAVLQLYNNATAMGSSTSARTTTATTYTISSPGTWTTSTLENLELRYTATRGTSNTSRAAYIYFYGAAVTVNYSYSGTQYTITATSEIQDVTVSPAVQTALNGESVSFTITPNDNEPETDFTVLDNDTDVTNSLIEQTIGGDGSVSAVPGSDVTTGHARSGGAFYQSSSTSSDAWLRYAIGHSAESPYSTSNTSNTYSKDGTNDATTQGWMIYPFDFSSIPINATIVSVQVKCYGATESTSETARHADISLWSGDTQKGSTQAFTSTSNSTITLSNVGTWTREELQNARLRFGVGYYGGRLLGVTWTVNYTAPIETIYTYTLSNLAADHEIVISQAGAFIPPDEDPQKTYYPITVSSINAVTNPANGTTRVESGTNQTITITPTDPQLTLALDNGVDITNQLSGGIPTNTYSVATASGASYGFNLNSSTGYYVSTNTGQSNSAAVARVSFNLETACTITFTYINYAEATYDYGIFGNIDTALSTTYTSDSNAYLVCSTSAYNVSTPQTVTYTMSAGTHYIDVKYRKDQATNSNNDNLQFKVDITALESGAYTYTLSNVTQKHSLIFIFGDVNYYFITSSGDGCKLYPDGQIVCLENDNYHITIVPNTASASISLTDNNVDKTSSLEYYEGEDKSGNTVVNYVYRLTNISAAHNLVISCLSNTSLYLKLNGTWTQVTKAYIKADGRWEQQSGFSVITNKNYVKKN